MGVLQLINKINEKKNAPPSQTYYCNPQLYHQNNRFISPIIPTNINPPQSTGQYYESADNSLASGPFHQPPQY